MQREYITNATVVAYKGEFYNQILNYNFLDILRKFPD